MYYSVTFHGYQLDFGDAGGWWQWQLEHVYRSTKVERSWGNRLYLAGFLDHNLWLGGDDSPWNSVSSASTNSVCVSPEVCTSWLSIASINTWTKMATAWVWDYSI